MTTMEYLKEAPKGTSKAAMQKIIQTHNGDRAKILAAIKELWAKHEEENSWVEVAPKQKKKAHKPVSSNKYKKSYNGHHQNGPRKQNSTWNQNKPHHKYNKPSVPSPPVEEEVKPPENSWASKLFKPEPEEVNPKTTKLPPPPMPPVEKKKTEQPKKKEAIDVNQIEAELFKESEEEAEKAKEIEPSKPKVERGVLFSSSIKKKAESSDISGLGRVAFGSLKAIEFNLGTFAQSEGKEVVPKGTEEKLNQLQLELNRARDEITHLKARQNEVQVEISQAADKNLKYSRRVKELEAEAKEKANLREEVSKLTKQLEEHQLQTRQYYDRMKEEPKEEDKSKPPQQPPTSNPPQSGGYNIPQQQPVYPGMQYFPGYYSQFHHYPPQGAGPGHPHSRYGYESHAPPGHPPAPSPPPEHHFPHEEFRGMRRGGLVPPAPSSRDMGIDKKAQHAPPGYGGQQHHPYSYPPNMVYQQQQQQQQFPPGQGQQKWNAGR